MSFDTLTATLAFPVGAGGSITFAYPSGRNADSYRGNGAVLTDSAGTVARQEGEMFSVIYGTTSIKVVYGAGPLVAAGTVSLKLPFSVEADVLSGASSSSSLIQRLKTAAALGGLPPVMASPPTVTAQAAETSTITTHDDYRTIVGAEDEVSPGVLTDYFEYTFTPVLGGHSYPDYLYIRNATVNYGATVGADLRGNYASFGFCTDAPTFEYIYKGLSGSAYRVLVNEYDGKGFQLVSATPTAGRPNDGAMYYDKYAFGSRKPRHIVVLGLHRVYGVRVDKASKVWKPKRYPDRIKAVFLGDSYTEGTGVDYGDGAWSAQAGYPLGWEVWNSGVGGTGYLANLTNTALTFRGRLTSDVTALQPDVIVIAGGINDSASASAIQTEAAALYAQALSENPSAVIFVAGPWTAPASGTALTTDTALRAAARAQGPYGTRLFYVETISDPQGAWQSGTGRVGATAGDGNSDVYIGTDGVHPVQAGHTYLGNRFATAVKQLLGTL
jgi:lysophospholipase L1-like esterase